MSIESERGRRGEGEEGVGGAGGSVREMERELGQRSPGAARHTHTHTANINGRFPLPGRKDINYRKYYPRLEVSLGSLSFTSLLAQNLVLEEWILIAQLRWAEYVRY